MGENEWSYRQKWRSEGREPKGEVLFSIDMV